MELSDAFKLKFPTYFFVVLFTFICSGTQLQASIADKPDSYIEYKGFVTDKVTGKPLPFTNILLIETNMSTVSNSEGEFSIKISDTVTNGKLSVRFMGYKNRTILLSDLKNEKNKIELEPIAVELPEVSVISKDAESLVQAMMEKKSQNYSVEEMQMTAFYRETIKKNKILCVFVRGCRGYL